MPARGSFPRSPWRRTSLSGQSEARPEHAVGWPADAGGAGIEESCQVVTL